MVSENFGDVDQPIAKCMEDVADDNDIWFLDCTRKRCTKLGVHIDRSGSCSPFEEFHWCYQLQLSSSPDYALFFTTLLVSSLLLLSNARNHHCDDDVPSAGCTTTRLNGTSLTVKLSGVHWHYIPES